MTRKRYVKLLMSMGYTKRYAELRAKMDVSLHGSYSTAWTNVLYFFIQESWI